MTSSSSSDENFTPIGFDTAEFISLQRERKKAAPVMVKEAQVEESSLDPNLTYDSLLKRAFTFFQEREGKKGSSTLKLTLDIKREPNCKTSLNLLEVSEAIKRDPEHIKNYLFKELMTNGSVNAEGRLLLKGMFIKNQVQDAIREYVDTYVVCNSCKGVSDTVVLKEGKMWFVRCKFCGGKRNVSGIEDGSKSNPFGK